jgi:hypothetical protein
MGRPRPFAVEQVRRRASIDAPTQWRRLLAQARMAAARANGEAFGPTPDKGGGERWVLLDLMADGSDGCPAPFPAGHVTGLGASAAFMLTARTFLNARPHERRILASALTASAQAVEALMGETGR